MNNDLDGVFKFAQSFIIMIFGYMFDNLCLLL